MLANRVSGLTIGWKTDPCSQTLSAAQIAGPSKTMQITDAVSMLLL